MLVTSGTGDAYPVMQLTALMADVELVGDARCVQGRTSAHGVVTRHVLVFPAGYRLDELEGRLTILNAQGRVWGWIGQRRSLGGGEIAAPHAAIPDACGPPYWLVATRQAARRARPRGHGPPPLSPSR